LFLRRRLALGKALRLDQALMATPQKVWQMLRARAA
jgi:hypothetical protein